ncbi:THO complex, subunitTHOC2, N-terminal [Lasallia pustulata]|uniref:THO complex subunit 2 n=1 Tax=Lasallia pustulata TaxID=136370 RepID=A0A1W5CTF4_9LECA|nr:THO complex, subunitTHOC2, N-terminal [Lasallia pustulata]
MSPPAPPAQRSDEPKQPTAPRPPTPTSVVPQQTTAQDGPSSSTYSFEYLTKERLDNWYSTGRKNLVDIGVQARIDEDPILLGTIFQEIVRAGLEGRIDPAVAGAIVKDILGDSVMPKHSPAEVDNRPHQSLFDTQSLFLDCLSVLTEVEHTHSALKIILQSSSIPPLLVRQELESPFLEHLDMIRNTFVRVGIRQQTNLLYRQSNYNLLREETEGYSKLITELFTTSSNEPPTSDVVEDTFERVKGMIGAFDLDVGRVLDVTLDVFAAVLVKQYRFFVKYLRASSWWPQEKTLPGIAPASQHSGTLPRWALPGSSGWTTTEDEREELASARDNRDKLFWERVREVGMSAFFEIGGRRVEKSTLEASLEHGNDENTSQLDDDRKWIEATGTLPPSGNKVAAQVLGFKLRFYSSSARDPNDILPVNLIYLAALLIKVGFISLRDLYPHLWPADEAMGAVKEEKMKEKAERERLNRPGGGAMNALMTAGALADDTLPALGRLREADGNRGVPPKVETLGGKEKASTPAPAEEKEQLPEPSDQKVQLLKSLLCIGALPESLYILGRFPWLVDAFPDLPEHIHRILHHCLSKVYEPLQPLRDRVGLRDQQKLPDADQSGVPKGQLRLADAPARKVLRWAQLDKDDTNEGMDYRFYWDDWADNVPVCQSVDDVFLLCGTLLNYTGVKIGQDPALLLKIARIGNHSLANDSSDANLARWTDLSKRLLVPALSLTKCNPGVVNEMFELIKHFSTPTRYSIYAEWYSGQTSRLPDIKAAFDQARAETRDVLKRISKTNVKPMARALAKVAYASPGIVFSVAIGQIESYDNLIEVVVECARYFTYLGYDVLTWSLMSSLGGKGRNRVQADGMLTSRWLQALSLFAGKVFKRYSIMSPTPILQYVTDQLRKSNSTDLIVLEEITSSMAGIVSDTNFNEAQVLCMAGGEVLQAQTMLQLLDRRHESKITARRLMKSLIEPRLAGQLLIAIAQERQTCVFKVPESDAHLKLLGNLFDEIHRVLTQYLDLLRSNMSIREFDALLPDVSGLIGEFGIEPNVAFWISRPSIAAAVAEADMDAAKQVVERKEAHVTKVPTESTDVDMDDSGSVPTVQSDTTALELQEGLVTTSNGSPNGDQKDLEMKDSSPPASTATPSALAKPNGVQQPWHPVLQKIIESIRPVLPQQTWEVLSVPFYVTFWQLSLRDMLVPTQSYEDEISRQKKKIVAINSDRTDISLAGTQKKERAKKDLNDLQDRLRAELKDHVSTYSQTRSRLQKEKDHWFAGAWGKWDAINTALIEHCFLPRILISPVDAMYAFKLLKFLHSSGAANFRTMGVLDHIFREKRLTSLIFVCTSKEAENIGRFLNEVLRDLGRWHADKTLFEKEAFGTKKDLPGFAKKLSSEKVIDTFMDFEEFRRILLKWHRNLNSALKTCLSGGEYMHIRNAIIILKAVFQYFPAVNWMGHSLVASVTELSKSESREDLKIAATSLLGNLRRREKEWVLPQAFNLNESLNGTNGARATSARPPTPQPSAEPARALRAEAAEFQPGRSSLNGSPGLVTPASGKLEVEDGEIEDAKLADAATKMETPTVTVQQPQSTPGESASTGPEPTPAPTKSGLLNVKDPDPGSQPVSEMPGQPPTRTTTPQPQPQTAREEPTAVLIAAANQPSIPIPARPDLGRPTPDAANSRTQHSLPTRPEVLPPRGNDHRIPDRPGDYGGRELPRDARYAEHGHNNRAGEMLRDRLPERQNIGPSTRGYDRTGERPISSDRERTDSGWGLDKTLPARPPADDRYGALNTRDSRPAVRDERLDRPSRDRLNGEPLYNARNADLQGHSSRDSPMAPPRSNLPQHPDRAALIHGGQEVERGNNMNNHSERRSDPARYDSHPRIERGSRPPSPHRRDDRRPPRYDLRNEDRPLGDGRRPLSDVAHSHSSRYEEHHPPTAPRVDRPGAISTSSLNDRAREIIRPTAPAAPPADPNHGRLNHDSSGNARQAESQYGRLNPGSDVPSGPRLPNGTHPPSNRGGRNLSAPQPHINTQQTQASFNHQLPSPTVPDRQAPTGPASTRGGTWSSMQFSRPPSLPSSAPQTPATETPDISGIHPDRLKTIQRSEALQPSSTPSQGAASRATSQQSSASVSTQQQPPAGPRAPNDQQPTSPVGPSPSNRIPPTGPSFGGGGGGSGGAGGRGRGDKRFADIQNVLQQAGSGPNGPDTRSGQGASIRGRGSRNNTANVNAPGNTGSGPPTPGLGGRSDPLMGRPDSFQPRPDLFAGRGSGASTPQHHADDEQSYGRGGRRDSGRDSGRESAREGGERRATRHGRGSREHSTDRPPQGAPLSSRMEEERPPPPRRDEHRDLRSRGGGASAAGDRDPARKEFRDRDRRPDSDRREMEEWGGQRGGPAPGPDRRDERDRRDGGSGMMRRKRGHGSEDGPPDRGHGDGKRPRRLP